MIDSTPEPGDGAPEPLSGQQLGDLEASERRHRRGEELDRRFELFEAVLLSIAAVLAAWAGFQSAKWSGEQADLYNLAADSRAAATRASATAGQEEVADLLTFNGWLAAAEREGLLDRPPEPGVTYRPDSSQLSGFLYERFRPEFKVAADAWVATQPRTNPDAPSSPFVMAEYELASRHEAARFDRRSETQTVAARRANDRSDGYVLMTIMFATVLFFAGISSKMDTLRARLLLLSVGALLLLVSGGVVLSFPKLI